MQRQISPHNPSTTVSQIVRNNYRTSDVFKRYGINYCCSGNVDLQQACQNTGVSLQEIEGALQAASTITPLSHAIQFNQWKPDFLIDYIINIHHAYLHQTLPLLDANLTTYIEGHKKKYPELLNVLPPFKQLVQLLEINNKKEETAVFPYLKQLINAYNRKETYGSLFVKTMRMPLDHMLEKEHQKITDLLIQLRLLTNNYIIPADACTNYGVMFHKLAELDGDLVQHKHLENNILFPKVLEMEKELLQL